MSGKIRTQEVIPIFMSAGKTILEPTSVAIASILANTNSYIKFYILMNTQDAFTKKDKVKLESLKRKFKNFEINYIDIDPVEFQHLNLSLASYVKIDTYFRFLIPEIDKSINKAIYLDCDIIAVKDISELYNEDLEDKLIGAIRNDKRGFMTDRLLDIVSKTNIKDPYSYFNAGVLLLNCKLMRENNITEKLFKTAVEWNDKIDFADQDVLNIVFENKYKELSSKYNKYALRLKNIEDVNIIHFVGPQKPWIVDCSCGEYFWNYAKKYSPFYRKLYKLRFHYKFSDELLSSRRQNEKTILSILGLRIKFKRNFFKNMFSITNEKKHKVINLAGIKLKIKNKINASNFSIFERFGCLNHRLNQIQNEIEKLKGDNFHYILDTLPAYDVKQLFGTFAKANCSIVFKNNERATLQYLFPNIDVRDFNHRESDCNFNFLWGTRYDYMQYTCLKSAVSHKKPVYVLEDGFLKSVASPHDKCADLSLRNTLSFTINSNAVYFDGIKVSELEKLLNDKNLIITQKQKRRARSCIDKIVQNYLTKYNHQPIFTPQIGRNNVKKILVVDQTYGDMAIEKSCANKETFKKMLECAIAENPDADIIVKTHPDTLFGEIKGYYTGLKQYDNVYPYTEAINPVSLIQYCDEVYVCSSQMGFEALMCNKKVHTFGISFYSHYGLTDDRQKCPRRLVKRTIEEMFYIVYIMFSYYVNPTLKCRCEIEETIDYIIKNRKGLLEDYNLVCELEKL